MSGMAMLSAEVEWKRKKLMNFLRPQGIEGAFFGTRAGFAWATGGRVNRIANSSPTGVAGVLVTDDDVTCLTNTIEAPRFRNEELVGTGIDVVEFDWFDSASRKKVGSDLIRGRNVVADADIWGLGLAHLPAGVEKLRWQLTPEEILRYREGGRRAAQAVEATCREIRPGMTEHEIAGMMTHHVHQRGLNPVVTLVASDERVRDYRHPIPWDRKVQSYAMLVNCSEFGGLISNLTRFVRFGKVDAELARNHQGVCEVDAAVNLATHPGRTLGDLFEVLKKAYSDEGFPDQWRLHHQGGSTGYAGRDVFAVPGDTTQVLDFQAFAWNPSITGTKSEDTVLVAGGGVEVLTPMTADWPRVKTRVGMDRAGMWEG